MDILAVKIVVQLFERHSLHNCIFDRIFSIEEYKSLKEEIRDILKELNNLAKFSIVFTGLFFWFFAGRNFSCPNPFQFLPIIFTVLLGIRTLSLARHIKVLSDYLQELEKKYSTEEMKELGWEKHLSDANGGALSASVWAFWIINSAVSLYMCLWLYNVNHDQTSRILQFLFP